MSILMPFVEVSGCLTATESGAVIGANSLLERREIDIWGSTSPVQASVYQVDVQDASPQVLGFPGSPAVSKFTLETAVDDSQIAAVQDRLNGLPRDCYEIFPVDHPVNEGCHFPDPWGEATKLLLMLEEQLPGLTRPPANHNKISSRRVGRFALNEMHVDGFDGMRMTDGRRSLIWRHFINLSDHDVRWVAVVPFDPAVLDELIPLERTDDRFEPVYAEVGHQLPILLVPTRPRESGRLHGIRLPTTHVLHSEYGKAGDLLAIVNSLT